MRDLEAVDCVVSKIEKQRGLLTSLIESTFHAQRVTLVLIYRPHKATHCLQSLDGRVDTFWKASSGFETQKRCHEGKGVATRAFRSHNGKAPSKSICFPQSIQPPELHSLEEWRLEASECGEDKAYARNPERQNENPKAYCEFLAVLL